MGHKNKITVDINTIDYKSYDALYLPGGHAPLYLHINPKVIEIVKYFLEPKKFQYLFVIVFSLQLATKSISGRKLTGLPFTKIVAGLAGANYEETLCVVDGSLITAIGNPGLIKMMEEFLKALK